jgi:hypothetical protein
MQYTVQMKLIEMPILGAAGATAAWRLIRLNHHVAVLCLVAGLVLQTTAINCPAQTTPSLPPGVQDVVKLVKAGLGEEVILAHIKNTGAFYSLSADQLISLHDQGVSENEIKALLGAGSPTVPANPAPAPAPAPVVTSPAPTPAVTASAPAPPPAQYAPVPIAPAVPMAPTVPMAQPGSLGYFQAQLAPYGTWMDVPGNGLCWRPSVAATDPYWRPYCDQGHWIYTADGWFWQSDYPWGDIAFHYGRWYRDSMGWIWVPGYDWAPAWVCWRQADGYCGWAPLPPGAVFKAGVGLWFGGRLAVDVDFGLGAEMFTFVPYDRFWDHNLHAYLLPRERVSVFFGHSVVMNGYRLDHGRFVVEGLGRERMAGLTHHEIRVEVVAVHGGVKGHEEVERRVVRDEHKDRHDH